MKDQAVAIAMQAESPAEKMNLLREYLQAFTLRSLHESEAFTSLSFVGGTALRFVYDLPRFSEELDFSLEFPESYAPLKWMKKLKTDLNFAGFDAAVSWNDRKTVHTAWIKVGGIMNDVGLSPLKDQKLSIKLEIDTRPPKGAELKRSVISRHLTFALQYHQLSSLMACKTHALLTRKYQKGRDWYDLLWYLGQRPPIAPNVTLLRNALIQTLGEDAPNTSDWRMLIERKIESLDFNKLVVDVQNFLEYPKDADLLTPEHFSTALNPS